MDSPRPPLRMDGADSRLLSGSVAIPSPPQPRRLVQSFHAALREGLADAVRRPAARSRARQVTRDETNRSSAAATTTADPTATTTSPDEDGVAVLAVNSVHDVLQERLDKAVQKGQVVDLTDDSPPLPRKPLKTTRDARGHEIIWLDDGDEEDVLVEENDSSSSTAAAVPSIPNERATAECTACLASIRSTVRPLLCTTCDQTAQIVPPPRALPAVLAQILHPGRDSTTTSERDNRAARRQSSNNATVEEFASAPKRSRRDNRGTVQKCVEDILHP